MVSRIVPSHNAYLIYNNKRYSFPWEPLENIKMYLLIQKGT